MFLPSAIISFFLACLVILYTYFKWSFQYWQKKKVPFLKPAIPFGNIGDAITGKSSMPELFKNIYLEMKRMGYRHGGVYIFSSANYMPISLEYFKMIMVKDFQYFVDRSSYYNENVAPISPFLFMMQGERWSNIRMKTNPVFTTGKLKHLIGGMANFEENLVKRIDQENLDKPIRIDKINYDYILDGIAETCFGMKCNALEGDSDEFKALLTHLLPKTTFQRLYMTFCTNFPEISRKLNLSMISKPLSDSVTAIVEQIVKLRKKNNIVCNDLMQTLIEMKIGDEKLSMGLIGSQFCSYFVAGTEATSLTISYGLYHLARNPEIQEKARKEILDVLEIHGGIVCYEAVKEMKYLSQIFEETLRIHPVVPLLNRRATKDYKLPNEDLIIEKNTVVIIPIMGLHHDPEYYPDPERFDPERFNEENRKSIPKFAYIPFGEGPRICIASRLGQFLTQVGWINLLKNYNFTVNFEATKSLKYIRGPLALYPENGIWLNAKKINH